MINNVTDLKNRTMVESNILKSIILSSTDDRLPAREDILIHDYQIANSVTINAVLSNYIVNLKYAWNRLLSGEDSERESYFQIVDSLEQSQYSLDDDTKMVMEIVNGAVSFKSRKMVYQAKEVELDKGVVQFQCLDSVWYGKQRCVIESGNEYDNFVIVDGMNDFHVNPNPYGENIFDCQMEFNEQTFSSFNDYAKSKAEADGSDGFNVGSVVENLFYHNEINGSDAFSSTFTRCRYIMCMDNGLYGIEPKFAKGEFSHIAMHDIGCMIENLDSDQYRNKGYEFKMCGFQVVGGLTSLVVVVSDSVMQTYHYLFLNENSHDSLYGFKQIDSLVTDGLVLDQGSVFTRVESIRQLDNVCIALTNYGFWDIEPNMTSHVTYSYQDVKNYETGIRYGNSLTTKIVRPEFQVQDNDRIFEYDRVFTHDVGNGTWNCDFGTDAQPRTVRYLDSIRSPSGKLHSFVGGTDSFAIYDSSGDEPAYIVPQMTYEQFREMIFSSSSLLNGLLDYFYEQSVHSGTTDPENPPYGEYYLKQNHDSFRNTLNGLMRDREFSNMPYRVVSDDLAIGKFDSILSLVQYGKTGYETWNLHRYCQELSNELEHGGGLEWLIKSHGVQNPGDYLKQQMDDYFHTHEYEGLKYTLQQTIADEFMKAHPLLGHFQEYINLHIQSHLDEYPYGGISIIQSESTVDDVKNLIRNQVSASLILKDGLYEGIQPYLHHHEMSISRNEVRSIMSSENLKNQMVLAVKSAPFFASSHTYIQMKELVADPASRMNLFQIGYNREFAAKSGLLTESDGRLNMDWIDISGFMFPTENGGELSQEQILKAFVRTQIYRPLYFKYDDYITFTHDSSQYLCETQKRYTDHNGTAHDLFLDGDGLVKLHESGLVVDESSVGYSITDVEYNATNNVLKYVVEYNPIAITDNKFVHQDVEHYVRRDESGAIYAVLFNEFQNDVHSACMNVTIDSSNRFVLHGKTYQIELDATGTAYRLSVDSATSGFHDDEMEFKCEITDDRFKIDGIWYSLVRSGTGMVYTGIDYAYVDDTKLVSVPVDVATGTCSIPRKNLMLKFYSSSGHGNWDRVKAVFSHWVHATDHVTREWCAFDERTIQLSGRSGNEDKTYEWCLANHILELTRINLEQGDIRNLGDGVLYQGGLDQATCTLKLVHEANNGDVVSRCVLTKKVGDNPETQTQIGVLYDKNMKMVNGKVLHGTLTSDGLLSESGNSTTTTGDMFMLIDPKGRKNNLNLVKISGPTWTGNVSVLKNVGRVYLDDEEEGIYAIDFGLREGYPRSLTMKQMESTQDNNIVYNWYQIIPNEDGSGKYMVKQTGDMVYAFVDGVRYAINMKTQKVDRLLFNEMPASVMDFSTQYSFDQLRDNLLVNMKQYMMNRIVQALICNGSLSSISMDMDSSRLGMMLDMFPDNVSLSDYMMVRGITDQNDMSCRKFLEVFKNSLFDIDDSGIYLGRVYQFLQGKIWDAFGNRNNLVVLEFNSMTPRLVNGDDTFSYEAMFNLHLMQNKNLMKENIGSYEGKWIVGDITIRNLRCSVTFTPKYTPKSGSNPGFMEYSVTYNVRGETADGKCDVDCDQIIYCLDGKIRKKVIPAKTHFGISVQEFSYNDGTVHDISSITSETIMDKMENLFDNDRVKRWMVDANNQITGTILVDSESRMNPKKHGSTWDYGGIWELDEQMPDASTLPGDLVYLNRGNVTIDGDMYDVVAVEDEDGRMIDKYIEQSDGPGRFEIVQMDVHRDVTEDGYDSEANIMKKHVVKGETIVSRQSAEDMFTVETSGDIVYMQFRGNQYDFLVPSFDKTYTFKLSEISHIEELLNSIDRRTLVSVDKKTSNSIYDVKKSSYDAESSRIRVDMWSEQETPEGITSIIEGSQKTVYVEDETPCVLLNDYVPYSPDDEDGDGETNALLPDGISEIGNDLTPGSWFKANLGTEQLEAVNSWLADGSSTTIDLEADVELSGYFTQIQDDSSEEDETGEVIVPEDDYVAGSEDDEGESGKEEEGDEEGGEEEGTEPKPVVKTSGWFGRAGKFKVRFRLEKGEDNQIVVATDNGHAPVIVQVYENSCVTLGGLVSEDASIGEQYTKITTCTMVAKNSSSGEWTDVPETSSLSIPLLSPSVEVSYPEQEAQDAPESDESQSGENQGKLESVILGFRVYARVVGQMMALAPLDNGDRRMMGYFVLGKSDDTYYVKGMVSMTDFLGNPVGNLNYGYVDYPVNLAELVAEHGNQITYADIQYKTTCFMLDSSRKLSSDGMYCPFALHVIPPSESSTNDGEVYNRFYEISLDIHAEHESIPLGHVDDGKFWMDMAGTMKSIYRPATEDDYRKLTHLVDSFGNMTEDMAVPDKMREDIEELIGQKCNLDQNYFTQVLAQLEQFLLIVMNELEGGIDKGSLLNMCNFMYDKKVSFKQHTGEWNDVEDGLFGYHNDIYQTCKDNFNNYLKGEFKGDFSSLKDVGDVLLYDNPNASTAGDRNRRRRDYNHILLPYETLKSKVEHPSEITWDDGASNRLLTVLNRYRNSLLTELFLNVGNSGSSLIDEIFGDANKEMVRYISAVPLNITGEISDMFVANGYCNLIYRVEDGMRWNRFVASRSYVSSLLDRKGQNSLDFTYETRMMDVFGISDGGEWRYRFGNRDLSITSTISDQFFIHCHDSVKGDAWYHSEIGGYLYARDNNIVDMAYEQNGNSTYVIFEGDNRVYRYDNLEQMKDFDGFVLLQKENATMKIETRHSTKISTKNHTLNRIFIDYVTPDEWTIDIYGSVDGENTIERWENSPGSVSYQFGQYNTVMFGDSLFNNNQLKFQNISKNKEMFDILDIYEVDGSYYGMFRDGTENHDNSKFVVFRSGLDSDVVQKLPYCISLPNFFRSIDDLYSLFVVEQVQDEDSSEYRSIIREISVPDSDLYGERTIDIESIIPRPKGMKQPLEIRDVIMSKFRTMDSRASFFVLSNWGFHRIGYMNEFKRVSIDTIDELRGKLWNSLKNTIMGKHMDEKHRSDDHVEYFNQVAQKINQFSDDFDVFSLIPAEFGETQEVGVIPSGQIDDTDRDSDHRPDSVLMTTDILQTQGMVAQKDTNPGIVTCAVSNPATNYGSNPEVMKSQRNPQIEGTGFYDFMYDTEGRVIMDLYQIPFIYQVNSNNTYDLYINVPTTRTKYLNRIAGTLKPDMTTQVLPEDVRARRNFQNSALPNNLTDSTTRLRVYIDRKYISVGNVELVEISGNSIPLQIYRDVPNNGLYDSIALESRWNGEVVEINDPGKDINKVMLEFECYGTDSQSIHIQGKTLVNSALDDRKYRFG